MGVKGLKLKTYSSAVGTTEFREKSSHNCYTYINELGYSWKIVNAAFVRIQRMTKSY